MIRKMQGHSAIAFQPCLAAYPAIIHANVFTFNVAGEKAFWMTTN